VAQGPVVHVHDPLPDDAGGIDAQRVAVGDVVVEGGRKQVVGDADGVEVAREVQVDVLHGHHLGIAAAGRAALDAEARAQGRFPDAQGGLAAQAVQGVGQADGGGGLAFPGRGGGDGGDQDQLADRIVLDLLVEVERDLGLGLAVRFDGLRIDAELGGDLIDGQHGGGTGDVDIGRDGGDQHGSDSFKMYRYVYTNVGKSPRADRIPGMGWIRYLFRTFAAASKIFW
jgi:rRNA processing protein Krr1/Pno1